MGCVCFDSSLSCNFPSCSSSAKGAALLWEQGIGRSIRKDLNICRWHLKTPHLCCEVPVLSKVAAAALVSQPAPGCSSVPGFAINDGVDTVAVPHSAQKSIRLVTFGTLVSIIPSCFPPDTSRQGSGTACKQHIMNPRWPQSTGRRLGLVFALPGPAKALPTIKHLRLLTGQLEGVNFKCCWKIPTAEMLRSLPDATFSLWHGWYRSSFWVG